MSSYQNCFHCKYYNGATGYCRLHQDYHDPDDWCPDCSALGQHYSSRDYYDDKCCKNCWYRNSDGYCRKRSEYVDGDDSCTRFTYK